MIGDIVGSEGVVGKGGVRQGALIVAEAEQSG
jgi:hypothetical protein